MARSKGGFSHAQVKSAAPFILGPGNLKTLDIPTPPLCFVHHCPVLALCPIHPQIPPNHASEHFILYSLPPCTAEN